MLNEIKFVSTNILLKGNGIDGLFLENSWIPT